MTDDPLRKQLSGMFSDADKPEKADQHSQSTSNNKHTKEAQADKLPNIRDVANRLQLDDFEAENPELVDEAHTLYQASRSLNLAQTYDDILTVLRSFTCLGRSTVACAIFYFDKPWNKNETPMWLDLLACRTELTSVNLPPRLSMTEIPDQPKPFNEPIVIPMANTEMPADGIEPTIFSAVKTKFLLCVPLGLADYMTGMVVGFYQQPLNLSTAEQDRLMAVASQAAVTIQSIYNLRQVERRAAESGLLQRIIQAIPRLPDQDTFLADVYQALRQFLAVDVFFVGLYDDQTHLFEYPLVIDQEQRYSEVGQSKRPRGAIIEVVKTGKPVLINRTPSEVYEQVLDDGQAMGDQNKVSASLLYVPLYLEEKIVGIISVQSYSFYAYSAHDVNLLTEVASQVAIVLEIVRQRLAHHTDVALPETESPVTAIAPINLQAETLALYEISRLMSAESTLQDVLIGILGTLQRHDFVRNVHAISLTAIELDDYERPEWSEIIAGWNTETEAPYDIGRRFYLPDLPLTPLWADNPSNILIISDARVDPRLTEETRQAYLDSLTLARVLIPLHSGGRWIGQMSLSWDEPQTFTAEDERIYHVLMQQITTVVDKQRLFDERKEVERALTKRATELETVARVSIAASNILNPTELLQTFVELTKSNFNLYHTQVYLFDETGSVLTLAAAAGEAGQRLVESGHQISIDMRRSLVSLAAKNRKGIIVNDVTASTEFLDQALLPDTRSEMAIPITAGNDLLGVLDVQSNKPDYFTPEDLSIQTTFAAQIAVALQNARSFERSELAVRELDALTRRLTRQGWREYLQLRDASDHHFCYDLAHDQILSDSDDMSDIDLTYNITIQGELVGGISISEPTVFVDELDDIVEDVIGRLGAHLESLRLADQRERALTEMEQQANRLNVLSRLGADLGQTANLDDAYDIISSKLPQIIDSDHISITLINPAKKDIDLQILSGTDKNKTITIPTDDHQTLIGKAMKENQLVRVTDLQPSDGADSQYFQSLGLNSSLIVPLSSSGQVVGALSVGSKNIGAYSVRDEGLLVQAAALLASLIENHYLFDRTLQALSQAEILFEMSRQIGQASNLEEILVAVTEDSSNTIFDRAVLGIFEYNELEELEAMIIAADWDGTSTPQLTAVDTRYSTNQFQMLTRLQSQEPIISNDTLNDEWMYPIVKDLFKNRNIRSMMCLPMWTGRKQSGILILQSSQVHEYQDHEVLPYVSLTRQIASAVENIQLLAQLQGALTQAERLYETSRQINRTESLQALLVSVAQAASLANVNRIVLFDIIWNEAQEAEAIKVKAHWYRGTGTPPAIIGQTYMHKEFPSISNFLGREAIIFEDVFNEDRLDEQFLEMCRERNIRAMALIPLRVGGQQIGMLALQADQVSQFSSRYLQPYISLAPQIAVAVENQRLLDETRTALENAEATQRRYTVQAWESYRERQDVDSYIQAEEGIDQPLNHLSSVVSKALTENKSAVVSPEPNRRLISTNSGQAQHYLEHSRYAIPLTTRNEIIGILGLEYSDENRQWTEDELAFVDAVATQLAEAAENLRLVDETQRRAARERQLNQIAEKIQAAQSMEEALQVAITEVGSSLKVPRTSVQLEVE